MIIELIRKIEPGQDDWYSIKANGKYVTGSFNFEKAELLYQDVLEKSKKGLIDREIVLKSEEVDVSL
jgi:hypothetical protein